MVVVATYALRGQVRKVKQADMKVAVSALLLSFATFWFGEVFVPLDDLLLIPLFLLYAGAVYRFANRPSPKAAPLPSLHARRSGFGPSLEGLGPPGESQAAYPARLYRMVETPYLPPRRRPSSNLLSLKTETS